MENISGNDDIVVKLQSNFEFAHDPAAESVDDDVNTVLAGMVCTHYLVTNLPPGSIAEVRWVVPTTGGPVADYQASPEQGVMTPLDLNQSATQIDFAWTVACETTVTCVVVLVTGQVILIGKNFQVLAPVCTTYFSMTSTPSIVPVGNTTMLRFGAANEVGIAIFAQIAAPTGYSGQVGILQLARESRSITHIDGSSYRSSIGGTDVLDVGPAAPWTFYQNMIVEVAGGGPGIHIIDSIDITDAPAIELNSATINFAAIGDGPDGERETYSAYLMFRPHCGGPAIWVPFGLLQWNWEGTATYENGAWVGADFANTPNPTGIDYDQYPTWTTNTQASTWIPFHQG